MRYQLEKVAPSSVHFLYIKIREKAKNLWAGEQSLSMNIQNYLTKTII